MNDPVRMRITEENVALRAKNKGLIDQKNELIVLYQDSLVREQILKRAVILKSIGSNPPVSTEPPVDVI